MHCSRIIPPESPCLLFTALRHSNCIRFNRRPRSSAVQLFARAPYSPSALTWTPKKNLRRRKKNRRRWALRLSRRLFVICNCDEFFSFLLRFASPHNQNKWKIGEWLILLLARNKQCGIAIMSPTSTVCVSFILLPQCQKRVQRTEDERSLSFYFRWILFILCVCVFTDAFIIKKLWRI